MNIAIALAAATAIATFAGGTLAIKSKDRLHLVLGLSAGLLLGLVAFDLLPEVFELGTTEILHAPATSVALIAGFLLLHFFEQLSGSHEPAESDYGHDHKHSPNLELQSLSRYLCTPLVMASILFLFLSRVANGVRKVFGY